MSEGFVNVTEGSGKKLHTNEYTVGANTVGDEVVVLGPHPYPTYTVTTVASTGTANDHLLCLNAGASLKVRVHRIYIEQTSNAASASAISLQVLRTTTAAPTGGTALTPGSFDTSDAAAGATGRSLPTVKGTESTVLLEGRVLMRQTIATTGAQENDRWEWRVTPTGKPIIIPAGTTNGLVIKSTVAVGSGGAVVTMEFTETAF